MGGLTSRLDDLFPRPPKDSLPEAPFGLGDNGDALVGRDGDRELLVGVGQNLQFSIWREVERERDRRLTIVCELQPRQFLQLRQDFSVVPVVGVFQCRFVFAARVH